LYVAAARIVGGLPNFWERYDFVNSYLWSEDNREKYLGLLESTPEEELSKYYGETAIELLKKAMPNGYWELMAVPLPDEGTFVPINISK
jgi:hypothetical protein